jgi:HD-GYP domain-containing protein (c-di-GMP phosphodiesterase class II)
METNAKQIRLLYLVLGALFFVGVVPVMLAGWLFSGDSAEKLRSTEGRYQAQLVQDKARQIELYAQRYREVVQGLARAFELAGGLESLKNPDSDTGLRKTLQDDPNLISLSIEPVQGDPHRAFQPNLIKREELDARVNQILARINSGDMVISRPELISSGQEIALTIAAPVLDANDGIVAAIVAVVTFRDVFGGFQQTQKSERELLDAGMPVIFVVDQEGRAVAHPDESIAFAQKPMNSLKVVQDWMETSAQVASALAPFKLDRDGKSVSMLGAYGTAELTKDTRLGVIAMQDERAALASVTDMRRQTAWISMAVAALALGIGFLLAHRVTRPIQDLVVGARLLAGGDFSKRIAVSRYQEIGELGHTFNFMTERIEKYINELQHSAQENRALFLGTIKALAAAIDGKDPYTRGHSERVSRFSMAMAQRLGLGAEEVEKVRISALLHDVGKIGIDDNILKKPSALTNEEFEVMKSHPQKGFKIMSQIPAMKEFLPGMYMHHEMINGQGYPQGLKGEEIPLMARIVAVADTFDAMTTERPYQKAMPLDAALARIESFVGTRYDEKVVAALVAACNEGQIQAGRVKLNLAPPTVAPLPAGQPQTQPAQELIAK